MNSFVSRAGLLLILVATPMANAHADDSGLPGSKPEYGVMPMASEGSDPRLERRLSRQQTPKQDRRRTHPAAVLAIQGGVPIFVGSDIDRNVVRPGGDFSFTTGADLGYVVPELDVGYMAVPIDPPGSLPREPLQRVHLGLGARLQAPNNSPVIPYLSASFAFQWWKFDTLTGCTLLACSTGDRFRFAPGLSFRAGMTISFARSAAIDIGLRYGLSFQGDGVFTRTRQWVEPNIGFRFWI
ncbi:MAG: hypothetical protein WAU39_15435 [Polyangiales bacterium]